MLQGVASCCSVLQCIAVRCIVLQVVAVRCSATDVRQHKMREPLTRLRGGGGGGGQNWADAVQKKHRE